MSSSFWCNCRKCLCCTLSLCITVSCWPLDPVLGLLYLLRHTCSFMTWVSFSASWEHWLVLLVHGSKKSMPSYLPPCFTVCVFWGQKLAACLRLWKVKKCSGFTALHAGCLASCTTAPSILLVIIMPVWGLLWLQCSQNSRFVIYDQLKLSVYHHKGFEYSKSKALHFYILNTFL